MVLIGAAVRDVVIAAFNLGERNRYTWSGEGFWTGVRASYLSSPEECAPMKAKQL